MLRVPAARWGAGGQHRHSPPARRLRAAPGQAGPSGRAFRRARLGGVCGGRGGGDGRGGKQPAGPGAADWLRPSVGLLWLRRSQPRRLAVRAKKTSPCRPARPAARAGTRTADRKVPLRADRGCSAHAPGGPRFLPDNAVYATDGRFRSESGSDTPERNPPGSGTRRLHPSSHQRGTLATSCLN